MSCAPSLQQYLSNIEQLVSSVQDREVKTILERVREAITPLLPSLKREERSVEAKRGLLECMTHLCSCLVYSTGLLFRSRQLIGVEDSLRSKESKSLQVGLGVEFKCSLCKRQSISVIKPSQCWQTPFLSIPSSITRRKSTTGWRSGFSREIPI